MSFLYSLHTHFTAFATLNPFFVDLLNVQVEHQYSHRLKVIVVRAENVTKGAFGDLCEYIFMRSSRFLKKPSNEHSYFSDCVFVHSGHPGPLCGTVNSNHTRVKKTNTPHK